MAPAATKKVLILCEKMILTFCIDGLSRAARGLGPAPVSLWHPCARLSRSSLTQNPHITLLLSPPILNGLCSLLGLWEQHPTVPHAPGGALLPARLSASGFFAVPHRGLYDPSSLSSIFFPAFFRICPSGFAVYRVGCFRVVHLARKPRPSTTRYNYASGSACLSSPYALSDSLRCFQAISLRSPLTS